MNTDYNELDRDFRRVNMFQLRNVKVAEKSWWEKIKQIGSIGLITLFSWYLLKIGLWYIIGALELPVPACGEAVANYDEQRYALTKCVCKGIRLTPVGLSVNKPYYPAPMKTYCLGWVSR